MPQSLLVSIAELSELFRTQNKHGALSMRQAQLAAPLIAPSTPLRMHAHVPACTILLAPPGHACAGQEEQAALAAGPFPKALSHPDALPAGRFALTPLEALRYVTRRQLKLVGRDRVLLKGRIIQVGCAASSAVLLHICTRAQSFDLAVVGFAKAWSHLQRTTPPPTALPTAQVTVMALVVGSLYYQMGTALADARSRLGCSFLVVMFISMVRAAFVTGTEDGGRTLFYVNLGLAGGCMSRDICLSSTLLLVCATGRHDPGGNCGGDEGSVVQAPRCGLLPCMGARHGAFTPKNCKLLGLSVHRQRAHCSNIAD